MNNLICKSVAKVNHPDGIYRNGHWGGWEAWIGDNQHNTFDVDSGIRTPDFPVTIVVKDGMAELYGQYEPE